MRRAGPVVVVDTNVWISGVLTRTGAPARLTRLVVQDGLPVFTQPTFAELKQRLWLPKFDRYVSMEMRQALLHDLDAVALWVDVPQELSGQTFCRDPDDDAFIHAALAAKANYLVTGDSDLLVLSQTLQSSGIQILSPAKALQ
ncbi:MAG: putative toxin-antitoxin system toxin component, PIN family [Betaproteobacteria bacterium]|nr:putative toxin-antitoxin system toxin component, PIN family [Betaproteobacteria bacterium]